MNYSYDETFGVDLPTYCEVHGTDIETLIKKVELDIELLSERLKPLMALHFMEQDSPLIEHIVRLIRKKQKHKDRLNDWA